jgi:hypothetical protein
MALNVENRGHKLGQPPSKDWEASVEAAGSVYGALSKPLHVTLDMLSLAPPADLAHSALYALEGKPGMSALYAGFSVPFIGDWGQAGNLINKYGWRIPSQAVKNKVSAFRNKFSWDPARKLGLRGVDEATYHKNSLNLLREDMLSDKSYNLFKNNLKLGASIERESLKEFALKNPESFINLVRQGFKFRTNTDFGLGKTYFSHPISDKFTRPQFKGITYQKRFTEIFYKDKFGKKISAKEFNKLFWDLDGKYGVGKNLQKFAKPIKSNNYIPTRWKNTDVVDELLDIVDDMVGNTTSRTAYNDVVNTTIKHLEESMYIGNKPYKLKGPEMFQGVENVPFNKVRYGAEGMNILKKANARGLAYQPSIGDALQTNMGRLRTSDWYYMGDEKYVDMLDLFPNLSKVNKGSIELGTYWKKNPTLLLHEAKHALQFQIQRRLAPGNSHFFGLMRKSQGKSYQRRGDIWQYVPQHVYDELAESVLRYDNSPLGIAQEAIISSNPILDNFYKDRFKKMYTQDYVRDHVAHLKSLGKPLTAESFKSPWFTRPVEIGAMLQEYRTLPKELIKNRFRDGWGIGSQIPPLKNWKEMDQSIWGIAGAPIAAGLGYQEFSKEKFNEK